MEPNYEEQIKEIIKLMEERGYDAVAQLTGYLNENWINVNKVDRKK